MKSNNVVADLVFGIVFILLGYIFVFQRKRLVNALIESNRVFWGKMGFTPNQARGTAISNIMIPFMGLTFLIVSCLLLYRVITYFL
jgi:hypothetical protein